jgi:cytochrome c biogenesis protein CcdA
MIGFGLVLLVPRLNEGFALMTAGVAAQADGSIGAGARSGLIGQGLTGLLLGAVWSPCIGPTLGGAIGLASQGGSLGQAGVVMLAFAGGVASMMLALAYGTRAAIGRQRARLARLSRWAKPVMGGVLVAVGLAILFQLHHIIETWAVNAWPIWLQDLSVRF